MARSKIVPAGQNLQIYPPETSRVQRVKESIERSESNKEIYYLVKGHIKKTWDEIQQKNVDFNRREDRLKRFEEHLAKLGITWDSKSDNWQDSQRVETAIDLLKGFIDRWTLDKLRQTGKSMIDAVESIEKHYKDTEIKL